MSCSLVRYYRIERDQGQGFEALANVPGAHPHPDHRPAPPQTPNLKP